EITGSTASLGGAVAVHSGSLELLSSEVSGNTSTVDGGAIQAVGASSVYIAGSTIKNNTGRALGGTAIEETIVVDAQIYGNVGGGIGIAGTDTETVELLRVRLEGNDLDPGTGAGLHLTNLDTVTIESSTISNHDATAAAGGYVADVAELTIASTTFDFNLSKYVSLDDTPEAVVTGALSIVRAETVDIMRTTFHENLAEAKYNDGSFFVAVGGVGGGVSITESGEVSIEATTFSGNDAGIAGGGVHLDDVTTFELDGSTISGGTTRNGSGAGIAAVDVMSAALTNSTISSNSASGPGGGLSIQDTAAGLLHVTVVGNTATTAGGGIFVADTDAGSSLDVINSIVINNTHTGAVADDIDAAAPAFAEITASHSVVSALPASGALGTVETTDFDVDPTFVVGPLADNGGPVQTHLLTTHGIGDALPNLLDGADGRGIVLRNIDEPDLGAVEMQVAGDDGGQVFEVTATGDSTTAATLRRAVLAANSTVVADTITVDDGVGYVALDSPLPVVTSMTVDGEGAVVSGGQLHRVMEIEPSGSRPSVVLRDLEIAGGRSSGDGGAVHVHASDLSLDGVEVADSYALRGGAVFADDATVTATDSSFVRNRAIQHGGAIMLDGRSESAGLTLTRSVLTGNVARDGAGGGVYAFYADVTAEDSTISGNGAFAGGGMSAEHAAVNISRSTIVENETDEFGAANLELDDSTAVLDHVIVADGEGSHDVVTYGASTVTATFSLIEDLGSTTLEAASHDVRD
ncbi:MAG TPA: right-handed parallel beta-helix repeat-containing protein, partial [Acidimicrobiales bacterium]|nr:right-handed parallel beta-helix repeat-containing protein [Acidimicrobiales bacterium]